MYQSVQKPSSAFIGISWLALGLGILAYCVGLWNSAVTVLSLSEKGFYFTVLLYGLFAAVSIQKSVRDRLEGIPVTKMYYGLAWVAVLSALLLVSVGLWNAQLDGTSKGFYAMAYLLSLFGAIAVQKNTRDMAGANAFEQNVDPIARNSVE